MVYTCPKCRKEYPVPPKHCPCEPLDMEIEEGINYRLSAGTSASTMTIDAAEYSKALVWLKKQGITDESNKRKRDIGETGWSLQKQYYYIGIETSSVSEEVIYLSEEEFIAIQELLGLGGVPPNPHRCLSTLDLQDMDK